MEFEPLFALTLEDYSYPRYITTYRAYAGTMDELKEFVGRLAKKEGMNRRYSTVIKKIQNDPENFGTHTVTSMQLPIIVPIEEVYRREFTLTGHQWTYEAYDGSLYPVRADEVWISQIVAQFGTTYFRFSKAYFQNLEVFYKGSGWTAVGEDTKGFPAMVYKEGDIHYLSLHADEDVEYTLDEKEKAISDIGGWLDYNMKHVTRDIIGEG